MNKKAPLSPAKVGQFVAEIFENDLHAKRVLSLANATTGAIEAAALGVHAIGHGLAEAAWLNPKHAVKQVDRLLSNEAINPFALASVWVPFVVAERKDILVVLDWTDFDKDDHTTLAIHMVTSHGRSTPLLWKTIRKSGLSGNQTLFERVLVGRLREVVPADVKITLLADRGFGSCEFYEFLAQNQVEYVIRFRENIKITDATGECHVAAAWVPANGKAKTIRNGTVTGADYRVPTVICVRGPKMKDAWCLASSLLNETATNVIKLYGRRFTIEERFRDTKDIRFGMGLSSTSTTSVSRRDRLLLIGALAQALLTILGAAGESLGMDRMLKVNTVKRRTHSLFTQGYHYYRTIPVMGVEALAPLAQKFGELIRDQPLFRQSLGVI